MMNDDFGPDLLTLIDEDGQEHEFEVLDEIDRQWAKIKRGNPYGKALKLNTDQYIKNIAEGSI